MSCTGRLPPTTRCAAVLTVALLVHILPSPCTSLGDPPPPPRQSPPPLPYTAYRYFEPCLKNNARRFHTLMKMRLHNNALTRGAVYPVRPTVGAHPVSVSAALRQAILGTTTAASGDRRDGLQGDATFMRTRATCAQRLKNATAAMPFGRELAELWEKDPCLTPRDARRLLGEAFPQVSHDLIRRRNLGHSTRASSGFSLAYRQFLEKMCIPGLTSGMMQAVKAQQTQRVACALVNQFALAVRSRLKTRVPEYFYLVTNHLPEMMAAHGDMVARESACYGLKQYEEYANRVGLIPPDEHPGRSKITLQFTDAVPWKSAWKADNGINVVERAPMRGVPVPNG